MAEFGEWLEDDLKKVNADGQREKTPWVRMMLLVLLLVLLVPVLVLLLAPTLFACRS